MVSTPGRLRAPTQVPQNYLAVGASSGRHSTGCDPESWLSGTFHCSCHEFSECLLHLVYISVFARS